MKCLWLLFTLALLLSVVSAKKKKFDGDFEFVDEVSWNMRFYIAFPLFLVFAVNEDADEHDDNCHTAFTNIPFLLLLFLLFIAI